MNASFADKMFYGFDNFMRGVSDWFGRTVDHNCMLETCDSDHALSATNGSLVTLFDFGGALSQIGQDDYDQIITGLNTALGSIFNTPGRALQVVYHYDPDQVQDAVEKITHPSLVTARNLHLDLEDLLVDWNSKVSKYCAVERCYLAAWTRPQILTPGDRKRAHKKMQKASGNTPSAPGKQSAGLVMQDIRHEHAGFVEMLHDSFKSQNLIIKRFNCHQALWHIRTMTCPEYTSRHWKALLPGDPLPKKYADPGEKDYYGLLYPSLSGQLFPREANELDRATIEIGDMIHRPLSLVLPPQNPKPFQSFFRPLAGKSIPYRVSMLIEPDGLGGQSFKSTIASILSFTCSDNKRFKNALEKLQDASLAGETIVKLRVGFDTWTNKHHANALDKLRSQASILAGSVQAWGTCDVTENIGDPMLGVCATIPGLMDRSPAPASAAPLTDVIKMMPMRPYAIWADGSFLLRTPDGKIMPYSPLSSQQAAWIEIASAPQGAGKSVTLSAMNLAFILQPGLAQLPWLSCLDIGMASKGLINLLKSSLPPHLRHLVAYHRIRMEARYAINPLDTPLGCRKPLPSHLSFLVNLFSLFATAMDKTAPGEGVPGLARLSIERAYSMCADDAMPKPYSPGIDPLVDALAKDTDVPIDKNTTWWEVVDALFDAGHEHEAGRAQRYAVPLVSDIISACHQSEDIAQLYGADLIRVYTRYLSEAIQAYPILKEPTRFDIGDARVVSLDLEEVAPRGGAAADRQTAVMYMLGRHVVASRFFMMPADVANMPERYREYQLERINLIRKAPKRLCGDEVHRVTRNQSVANQFMDDLETASRESRKRNLSIGLYSQHMDDYPDIIKELATSVIVMGAGTKKTVNALCEDFGFNNALKYAMANLGKPGPKGANFVALFKTSQGDVYQTLTNTMSSMAIWAFSSTNEDTAILEALCEKLGVKKALRLLARHWPGGSLKSEVERRKLIYEENGLDQKQKDVQSALVDELLEQAKLEKT
jgi:intracellular multiplication protein IcmB